MNYQYVILAVVAVGLLICINFFILISNFVRVGPNQVLIVSGRKRQLPDGTFAGFRCVKGGGTFVWPLIEKAAVLSIEVFSVEMQKLKARAANGLQVQADCVAQVKIKGDDASIAAAAEHFLGKNEGEIKNLVRPILEKHLRAVLGNSSFEEVDQFPGKCADQVQAAASVDLGSMGLNVISFTIQNVRAQ